MADTTIPTDILEGVAEALEEVGDDGALRKIIKGVLDPLNPGAGQPLTPVDYPCKIFLYDYEDKYIDGTTVKQGDRLAMLDMNSLLPIFPELGDYVIEDPTGSPVEWKVVNPQITQVQSTKAVAIAQVRK